MADSSRVQITKLNNTNYQVWKFKLKMLLIKEDLWNLVVDDAPPAPDADWRKRDGGAAVHRIFLRRAASGICAARKACGKEGCGRPGASPGASIVEKRPARRSLASVYRGHALQPCTCSTGSLGVLPIADGCALTAGNGEGYYSASRTAVSGVAAMRSARRAEYSTALSHT